MFQDAGDLLLNPGLTLDNVLLVGALLLFLLLFYLIWNNAKINTRILDQMSRQFSDQSKLNYAQLGELKDMRLATTKHVDATEQLSRSVLTLENKASAFQSVQDEIVASGKEQHQNLKLILNHSIQLLENVAKISSSVYELVRKVELREDDMQKTKESLQSVHSAILVVQKLLAEKKDEQVWSDGA